MPPKKKKFYAYFVPAFAAKSFGNTKAGAIKQGVTDSWAICEKFVSGKTGARFKAFDDRSSAEAWLARGAMYEAKAAQPRPRLEPGVYFDAGTGRGEGVEISVTDEHGKNLLHKAIAAKELNTFGKHLLDNDDATNNYGELLALNYALEIARASGAIEVRMPRDAQERALMWKGRKSAFAAVGRISPNYYVQDGVIPRSEIGAVLREIADAAGRAGVRVANVFHAGDGNLHPLVLYDARVPGDEESAAQVAGEILKICVRHGGSITGEHGVGHDKAAYMGEIFNDADLETMNYVRCAFDPAVAFNPGKVFPTPRLCGDRPGAYVAHASETAGMAGRG